MTTKKKYGICLEHFRLEGRENRCINICEKSWQNDRTRTKKVYRHFLKTELRKVDQQQTQQSNDINKKGD